MVELRTAQISGQVRKFSSEALRRFIPEILLRNANACEALRHVSQKPAFVMFNYKDLKQAGYPNNKSDYVRKLLADTGNPTVILNSVCDDYFINNFDMNRYSEMALALRAKFVLSPDDFVYLVDDGDRPYQNASIRRALDRTEKLIELSKSRFNVIGLVIGRSLTTRRFFYQQLAGMGIERFAFPCGDLVKGVTRDSHSPMYDFARMCEKDNRDYILVGLHSAFHLKLLKPKQYSSPVWSMDASYLVTYDENYKKSKRPNGIHCKVCPSWLEKESHAAIHNIHSDFGFAQKLGGKEIGWTV